MVIICYLLFILIIYFNPSPQSAKLPGAFKTAPGRLKNKVVKKSITSPRLAPRPGPQPGPPARPLGTRIRTMLF